MLWLAASFKAPGYAWSGVAEKRVLVLRTRTPAPTAVFTPIAPEGGAAEFETAHWFPNSARYAEAVEQRHSVGFVPPGTEGAGGGNADTLFLVAGAESATALSAANSRGAYNLTQSLLVADFPKLSAGLDTSAVFALRDYRTKGSARADDCLGDFVEQ